MLRQLFPVHCLWRNCFYPLLVHSATLASLGLSGASASRKDYIAVGDQATCRKIRSTHLRPTEKSKRQRHKGWRSPRQGAAYTKQTRLLTEMRSWTCVPVHTNSCSPCMLVELIPHHHSWKAVKDHLVQSHNSAKKKPKPRSP